MKVIKCKCCGHKRTVFTGQELRYIRLNKGMTLKKLSSILNVSVSFLSDCEFNRRNMSEKMTLDIKRLNNYSER